MQRRRALVLLASTAVGGTSLSQTCPTNNEQLSHTAYVDWVANALKLMITVKPGMTREALLRVFTVEGGLSTREQRTYVSRECPYFKVDVEFKAIGEPEQFVESSKDIISKISRPYLDFSIMD